mmetsp:Transcript_25089/g.81097  ORF Transcript_25089/g.81097 Transcript_25089/m.81097 type:complete len:115 (+) Transcript_25089:296-640(+)
MREGCADSRRKRDCLARGASIISKGVRQRAAVDFDGAITSLLSGAMALCDGGDHVAARGAEALAMQIRGDRDAAQVSVARSCRDYVSCNVLASESTVLCIYIISHPNVGRGSKT